MIVTPYKRPPQPPTVALLTVEEEIIDEHGRSWKPGTQPDGIRTWCDYDTVRELVRSGVGEALCWNNEEIRWRDRRYEDEWRNRPTDVAVLKLPFPEKPQRTLAALASWRDWLARYRAAPTGTTGSAAMSLLRATLANEDLFCSAGNAPPLLQTMGGRLETGPAGHGSFKGRLEQLDLPAAYAAAIAATRYGGRWFTLAELPVVHDLEWWARDGRPVFAHARVRVPDGYSGPLIRRPRRRVNTLWLQIMNMTTPRYPAGVTLTGMWTWQELQVALEHGARIEKLMDGYVHLGGRMIFEPWWRAVQDGRRMPGLAGQLAKMTGNALWGRFCMDPAVQGNRTIRCKPRGRRQITQRPLAKRGAPKPAHDLAETISGQVRAELYRTIRLAGDRLLSAHTDGVWTRHLDSPPAGWRRKQAATRLDLIDPQTLRYWTGRGAEPRYVMAGQTARDAPDDFEKRWTKVEPHHAP